MTALTQCRCTKAWQVGQLPRTHYPPPPRDQPCNVLGNFSKRLNHCQQKNLSAFTSGCESVSQGYAGMLWRSVTIWNHLVPFACHAVVLDCTDAFWTSSATSAPCKFMTLYFCLRVAFTFVAELEMGIEWPWVPVPVSSSDSHCLTTIYQMHSIRHL